VPRRYLGLYRISTLLVVSFQQLRSALITRQSKIAQSEQKPATVDRVILREVLLTGLEKNIVYGKEYFHYTVTDSSVTAHWHSSLRLLIEEPDPK
jgi:chorismate-pyruvate lyase